MFYTEEEESVIDEGLGTKEELINKYFITYSLMEKGMQVFKQEVATIKEVELNKAKGLKKLAKARKAAKK